MTVIQQTGAGNRRYLSALLLRCGVPAASNPRQVTQGGEGSLRARPDWVTVDEIALVNSDRQFSTGSKAEKHRTVEVQGLL